MEPNAYPLSRLLADIPDVLSGNPVFVGELENSCRVVTVRKGDYLLRSGELCQNAYFINKGLFMDLFVDERGNECVTGFSSECRYPFLSAIGYITQAPSEFEIRAVEDGELLCFSRTAIEALSFRYPQFAAYYQQVMLMLISKLYSLFAIRQSCKAEEFIRYLYEHQPWIINRVPDKYIAQYTGVTTSWYCKLKKRLFR